MIYVCAMRQACKGSQLAEVPASEGLAQVRARPRVGGKFLFIADRKFYIKGVTYGTFRPDADGSQFPDSKTVERDFHLIADSGINAVRTYTVPPLWLLDAASRHGLYVMVGLPWEQHITFLDDPGRGDEIEQRVHAAVRACGRHPASSAPTT